VSSFYAYLTVVAGGLSILIILLGLEKRFIKKLNLKKFFDHIDKKVLVIGFVVSLLAVLGSLFYSEIAHYEPCKLCWFQRIFMYPLPLLFGLAFIKKERSILPYALMMSILGGLIALYQYFLQVHTILFPNIEISTPCSVVGYSPSCTQYFTLQLGYVTIPMMAFSAFLLITVALIVSLKKK